MGEKDPEYLSKFRENLKNLLTEIPDEERIATLIEALVEYRVSLNNCRTQNSILKHENSCLHVQLDKLKKTISAAVE